MMRVFFRWQIARWLRQHPGPIGVALIALLPLVYLAPLDRIPSFTDWRQAAAGVSFVTALLLSALCTRDSALVPDAAVWLFQKGIRIQDAFLARWSIDMGFVLVACIWSGFGISLGLLIHDEFAPLWVLQATVATALMAMIAGVLLFGMAAAGTNRGGDVLALLVFVSLLEPMGGFFLSATGRAIAHAFLLPIMETAALPRRLHEDPLSALHAAFHVTAWCTAWIAFGVWRLARWRPLPGLR